MFKNKYDERTRTYSQAGKRFAPLYKLTANNDLKLDGEKDLYAEIQSHAQSVDIKNIMIRYEMGDTKVLEKRHGEYLDLTDMPGTFAEVHQTVINAENLFNELPLEIRKVYNFSTAEYIADIGSDRWKELFLKEEPTEPIETKKEELTNE